MKLAPKRDYLFVKQTEVLMVEFLFFSYHFVYSVITKISIFVEAQKKQS